jgi:hypothetical protein
MAVYTNPTIDQEVTPKQLFYPDNKCAIFTCNGNPQGVIVANTGSIALSDNGSIYKKTTDDVNTGWVELQSGAFTSPAIISGSTPTLQFVDTDATPSSSFVDGADGAGANIVGGDLTIEGGLGTGTGVPGQVVVRYPLITSAGSSQQVYSSASFPVGTNFLTNATIGAAINNTVAETSLFATPTLSALSTRDIEGGISRIGTKYKLRFIGNISTTGSPTLQTRVKIGATTFLDTTAGAITTAGGRFWLDIDFLVTLIGAGGNVNGFMRLDFSSVNTGGATIATVVAGSAGTAIDFSATQTIDVTIQWGTANPSNSIQVFEIEGIRYR